MLKNIIETRLEFALKLFLEDKFGPISNRFIFIISIYFDAWARTVARTRSVHLYSVIQLE